MDARMSHARTLLDRLVAVSGARTIDNTLRVFDDVQLEIDAVGQQAQLIQSVHPDATMRETAEKVSQKVERVQHRGVAEPRRLRRRARARRRPTPTRKRSTT